MTIEEKQLLIQDLCARLPYGLKLNFYSKATNENYVCTLLGIEPDNEKPIIAKTEDGAFTFTQDHVKPYLRPMSNMTEEESKEFALFQTDFYVDGFLYPIAAINMINWLNEHHFDYCGLIPIGLGIDCTGLNIYENEKSI